jgi:FMN phosphatase YigB (HAD superfamily)
MIKAILFDMDGTLIENSMDTFLPPYFSSLSKKLAPLVAPDKLIAQLRASTQVMMNNQDPTRTLAQVFAEDFFPKLGAPREQVEPLFDDFYAREYRDLRMFTRHVEGAREIVARAFESHRQVVIATGPFFPLTALAQRLEWGGLADFPYAFITSFETMHACKPHAAYYREIAARLQVAPAECVMVGNDVTMDIAPARRAGMKTFWITDAGMMPTDVPTDWRGSLADFGELLERGTLEETSK